MKRCIFIGPSRGNIQIDPGITLYPPAAMGSIFNAVKDGYKIIALVDGIFGNIPTVWHKEILFAISNGVVVIGGASMGAIRASELDVYGMIGIGRAYRLYRRGLTDDEEVCVTHCPPELGYSPLTEPMINVRYTVRRLVRRGLLNTYQEKDFVKAAKEIFFANRDLAAISRCFHQVVCKEAAQEAFKAYCEFYVDVKRLDAYQVVKLLEGENSHVTSNNAFCFPFTNHWRDHFELRVNEIPPLRTQNH